MQKKVQNFKQTIVDEHNKIRTNPTSYIPILEEYLNTFTGKSCHSYTSKREKITREGKKPVLEAIEFLKTQAPRPEIIYDEILSNASQAHADYLNKNDLQGHENDKGEKPSDRVDKVLEWTGSIVENIDFGDHSAIELIISIIVDDGVTNRGHRTNLFRDNLNFMGIGVADHPTFQSCIVIDYVTKIIKYVGSDKKPPACKGINSNASKANKYLEDEEEEDNIINKKEEKPTIPTNKDEKDISPSKNNKEEIKTKENKDDVKKDNKKKGSISLAEVASDEVFDEDINKNEKKAMILKVMAENKKNESKKDASEKKKNTYLEEDDDDKEVETLPKNQPNKITDKKKNAYLEDDDEDKEVETLPKNQPNKIIDKKKNAYLEDEDDKEEVAQPKKSSSKNIEDSAPKNQPNKNNDKKRNPYLDDKDEEDDITPHKVEPKKINPYLEDDEDDRIPKKDNLIQKISSSDRDPAPPASIQASNTKKTNPYIEDDELEEEKKENKKQEEAETKKQTQNKNPKKNIYLEDDDD